MGLFDAISNMFKTQKQESKNVIDEVSVSTSYGVVKKELNVPENIKEDYRKTIFFYCENTATKVKNKKDYNGYLNYECGITNPDIYHQQLIDDGYYEPTKLEDILKKKTVTDLKSIAEENNISVKGRKEDIINALLESLTKDVTAKLVDGYYSLSPKGIEFYEAHQDYVCLHRYKDYQINLEDYYLAIKDDNYKRKFNDVAWGIFNERTLIYQKEKQYGSIRYNYFNMANLLMREEKKEHALQLYLYCLVIDLSGVESINHIESYKSNWCTKQEFLERIETTWLIPSLINQIVELKEYYKDGMLEKAYNDIYLPFNVSNLEFIKKLLDDAFNTAVFDIEKYNAILISNKKKKYLEMI